MTVTNQMNEPDERQPEDSDMAAIPLESQRPAPVSSHAWLIWLRAGVSVVTGLLFGLAIGGAITIFVATQFFNFKVLTVQTGSMTPTLHAGDVVIIRPTAIDKVKQHDIVLFADGKSAIPVVHRVVAIRRFTTVFHDPKTAKVVGSTTRVELITQGDANPQPDTQVTTDAQFQGKLWFSIPKIGQATNLPLQTALFALAGLIGVAWVSYEGYVRLGKRKKFPGEGGEQP